jgi:hypothetical protein
MSEDNLTVHILGEIRASQTELKDKIRAIEQRIEQRIAAMEQRSEERFEHVEMTARDQLHAMELRLATRITEQTAATRDLYDLLQANLQLRDRVSRCEQDIVEIKDRLD